MKQAIGLLLKSVAFSQGFALASRLERGLSTLRSSTATEDGQAASPSALSRRQGILEGPWDCPTRKRRKRRAPSACASATLNEFTRGATCDGSRTDRAHSGRSSCGQPVPPRKTLRLNPPPERCGLKGRGPKNLRA